MSISHTTASSATEEGENTNVLPATFVRGGTSKGVFLTKSSLPSDQNQWPPIFSSLMGSPDPQYGRQLNGMGGGVSSLSKIMVISPPTPDHKKDGIDVEYTFAQVGIRDESIDYSGNCGNLTSMIGVYAVDEGLGWSTSGDRQVVQYQHAKVIDTTFPISKKGVPILDLPQATVAGVPGKASKIVLDFVNPGGARTGKLLPSGKPTDILEIGLHGPDSAPHELRASLVDATNPTVFVDFAELNDISQWKLYSRHRSSCAGRQSRPRTYSPSRRSQNGFDPSAQAQPKIAILRPQHTTADEEQDVDIVCYALSMGVQHKAIPMTVGLCLGVASKIEGTLAWNIVQREGNPKSDLVRIRHPGGLVDVGAEFGGDGSRKVPKMKKCKNANDYCIFALETTEHRDLALALTSRKEPVTILRTH
ncbi:PrpF protein [Gymnopilus junonius]|uniref:PrpF protein n=1 Tax=Gymnopilus junonius TaxID=109634 RepID=A0A9P5P1Q9_GYMJU|nr:PrpF protein [Gymnopilus junonius]